MKRNRIITVLLCFLAGILVSSSMTAVSAEGEERVCFAEYGTREDIQSGYAYEGSQYAQVSLWKGETAYFKLQITADHEMDVTVTAEELANPKSPDTIPVSIGHLLPAESSMGMGMDASVPHETTWDRIHADNTAHLSAGETAWFWISAKAGAITPGKYEGRILVKGDHETELGLSAVVSPFSIAEEEVVLDLWQYPYSSYSRYSALAGEALYSEAHCNALKQELALYQQAGGNRITCTISDEPWSHQTYYDTPSMVKWSRDGSGNLWFDYTAFDAWVRLCESCGINGDIECFSVLPFDNTVLIYDDMDVPSRVYLEPGTYEWETAWKTFLYSFLSHMNENGWLDRIVLAVDERGVSSIGFVQNILQEIPEGSRVRLSAAVNTVPADISFYDAFDSVSLSIAAVPEGDLIREFLNHRREAGKETTLYNCSTNYPNAFARSDPYESVWTMQYLAALGFDGYLRWALNAWPQALNESTDNPNFESGDTFLIYPDEADSSEMTPSPSVRLCMIEKGLADAKKYRILARSLNGEAAELLKSGFETMERYYGAYNSYGAMGAKNNENRILLAQEVERLEALLEKASVEMALQQRNGMFSVVGEMQSLSQ